MRRTKIICTLGPASSSEHQISQLIDNGMNAARLNFSHGTHEFHKTTASLVRRIAEEKGVPVALIQDLQGPRVRLGKLDGDQLELRNGTFVTFQCKDVVEKPGVLPLNCPELYQDVEVGENILISDGRVRLVVTDVSEDEIIAKVEVEGVVRSRSGLNMPDTALRSPALTPKDVEDVKLGLAMGVDYIALSFVRSVLDIHQLREYLAGTINAPKIIAKIERPKAVEAIEPIIDAADGIMIARGDLGVELPPERVPLVQKEIILKARSKGKITITATQMLESMCYAPIPTRAEASDVANAVLDGTSAVMLSGETAMGEYPVEAVKMMSRIVLELESSELYQKKKERELSPQLPTFASGVALASTTAANEVNAVAICAFTSSGRTARLLKSHRSNHRIVAFTPNFSIYHQMALYWGVTPIQIDLHKKSSTLFSAMEKVLLEEEIAQKGDTVVLVLGVPIGCGVEPNTIKLHPVGGLSSTLTSSWDVSTTEFHEIKD